MPTASLDRTTARAVIALANRAPSVHNSQPWRWRIGTSSIDLFADPGRALTATDPEGRDLPLSCGAALHHLRVALLAAGLGTTVHRLPDPAQPTHLATVEIHPGRPSPEDLALARAIENRRSDRRVFSSWPVPPEMLTVLVERAAGEGALLRVLDRESDRSAVARLIEHAAVEQALSPDMAQETAEWTGRARGVREGVPAANIPAEPGGTVPVRQFARGDLPQSPLGRYEPDGTVLRCSPHPPTVPPIRCVPERRSAPSCSEPPTSGSPRIRSVSRSRCPPHGPSCKRPSSAARPRRRCCSGWVGLR